ncbi:hypothetical protein DFQ26_002702, partial [Actinomortierella ambigua]
MKEGHATTYNNTFQRLAARVEHFDAFQAVRQWKYGTYSKIQEFVARSGLEPDDLSGHMALAEEIDRSVGRPRFHKSTPRTTQQNSFPAPSTSSNHSNMYDMDLDTMYQHPVSQYQQSPQKSDDKKFGR